LILKVLDFTLKPSDQYWGKKTCFMTTLYYIKRLLCILLLAVSFPSQELKAQEYEVEMATFNSAYSDFGSVRYKDGLIFCSNRNKKKLSFDEDSTNFYTDMFFTKLKANNTWTDPAIFSNDLTDYLNEGPATFDKTSTTIYYTTNYQRLRPSKKERVDEYVLGIQAAQLKNGTWQKVDLFPFNAPKTDYNVAHPSLSPNDSALYFASNMPGGLGGMDIYKCIWRNNRWSQPINLGGTINTKGDELFPFVSIDSQLYFTTNGHSERSKKHTDIYSADIRKEGYSEPYPLPYPMNTEFDDFAYCEYSGPEFGSFSSNREQDRDKVYTFRMNIPNFMNCLENQRPILCYTIEDLRISEIDSLPLVYEWELGDGNRARGLSIEHCFEKPGQYHIALNVIDTISNSTFFGVSEADLTIPDIQQPFILSSDTVLVNQPMKLFADLHSIKKFKVEKHYWIIDHKYTFTGDTLPYVFKEPGYHSVVCGVVGRGPNSGRREKACAFKEILVMNDTLPGFPKPDPDPNAMPMMKIKMRQNFDPFIVYRQADLAPVYEIVLAKSTSRLNFENPVFEHTEFQISERIDSEGTYIYTVGKTEEIHRLLPIFRELQKEGFREAKVVVFNEPEMEGVDWATLRNQNMIDAAVVSKAEHDYFKQVAASKNYVEAIERTESEQVRLPQAVEESTSETFLDKDTLIEAPIEEPSSVPIEDAETAESSEVSIGSSSIDASESVAKSDSPITENTNTLDSTIEGTITTEEIQPTVFMHSNLSEEPTSDNELVVKADTVQATLARTDTTGTEKVNAIASIQPDLFHVIIIESPIRIPLNDPFFSRIEKEIIEIEGLETAYTYAVGISHDASELEPIMNDLRSNGYDKASIQSFNSIEISKRIVRKGTYIAPKDAEKLNIEFSRLQDIKFEYNSAVILNESRKNLDYIAAMLMLEDGFDLKINAHTCTIGGHDFNMDLSSKRAKSVEDYFVSKGISRERMHSKGFAASRPLVDNSTDYGRRQNRRVEFIIVFNTNPTAP